MARLHNLKTLRGPFRAIWYGEKTAEFRLLDRDFAVGDTLVRETIPGAQWAISEGDRCEDVGDSIAGAGHYSQC